MLGVVLLLPSAVPAQTTIATGSIQGTVSDPTGAVVKGAKVTIRNTGTGNVLALTATSSGTYTSGALLPGNYVVSAESEGFARVELPVVVQVGVTSSGNIRLKLEQQPQQIEVQASELRINAEQATLQGVLTIRQIENLPVNGGNFLDLAQLEPGVQVQDASNFDPTKGGFTGISIGGRSGRTTRIELDGLDISTRP
jgi:Carboxypeptidase regulatory-like domain